MTNKSYLILLSAFSCFQLFGKFSLLYSQILMPVTTTDSTTLLTLPSSSLLINSTGATITSWNYRSKECLYLSPLAILDGTKAIRGGIPVVFPQFGPDPLKSLPQHGFARSSPDWKYKGVLSESADAVCVSYSLCTTTSDWPHAFKLVMKVTLREGSFTQELVVENTGKVAWKCTPLLQYLHCFNSSFS
jgi:glucose-6-phosphate 1-epimerase